MWTTLYELVYLLVYLRTTTSVRALQVSIIGPEVQNVALGTSKPYLYLS